MNSFARERSDKTPSTFEISADFPELNEILSRSDPLAGYETPLPGPGVWATLSSRSKCSIEVWELNQFQEARPIPWRRSFTRPIHRGLPFDPSSGTLSSPADTIPNRSPCLFQEALRNLSLVPLPAGKAWARDDGRASSTLVEAGKRDILVLKALQPMVDPQTGLSLEKR